MTRREWERKRFRAALALRGVRIIDLCRKWGVSRATFYAFESGDRKHPRLHKLYQKVLGSETREQV